VSGTDRLPSGGVIAARFAMYKSELPAMCAKIHLMPDELTFIDHGNLIRAWLASPQSMPA